MKRALKILGVVVVLIIIVLVALPFLINVNAFRPRIESDLSNALGREVKVGNLSLSLMSGSVAAEQLSIADDPAFSKAPFVQAKALKVGVEMMPLIFSKQVHVTNLTLDQPQIALIKSSSGKWNFSSLGKNAHAAGAQSSSPEAPSPKAPEAAQKPAQAPSKGPNAGEPLEQNLSVAKLNVTDGRVSIGDANSNAKPRIYDRVDVTVSRFSMDSQFPFTLTCNLPGGGDLKLDGTAGPIDADDAASTPVQAKLKINQLNLAASGFVEPSSGVAGIANIDAALQSDGHVAKSSGTVNADKLKLSPKGSPASRPVQLKYATEFNLDKQTGVLTQGDVALGQALAHLTGNYDLRGAKPILNMKLDAANMAVNELQAMLPALGVILPQGSSLQGGTLSTNLNISGAADNPVITGPLKLIDTKLAGFDLGSKLAAVSALSGAKTGNDTSIKNLSTDARVAPDGITTNNVNLNIPALGTVTGSGNISPAGALNYRLTANVSGSAVSGLSQLAGMSGNGASIPFFVQGTTSNPQFVPDVKGLVGSQLGNQLGNQLKGRLPQSNNPGANQAIDALGGLFGKKKKKQ
jgi:AsmA protein